MQRIIGTLLFLTAPLFSLVAGDLSVRETHSTIEVHENERLIAVLRTEGLDTADHANRLHYLHPLIAPGGDIMTEDMPADHVHQRGIYWAWRQIRLNGEQIANSWTLDNIQFEPRGSSYDINELGEVTVTSDIAWKVRQKAGWQPIVQEHVVLQFYPSTDRDRKLDIEVTLQALLDGVEIGGAPNSKGYGGVSARFIEGPAMRFFDRNSKDEIIPTPNPVHTRGGVTMKWDETSNLAPYEVSMRCSVNGQDVKRWILRRGLSMQNCVWPGRKPTVLPVSKPISLSAEIVVALAQEP